MKKGIFIVLLLAVSAACTRPPSYESEEGGIIFNRAQPLGQRSLYSVRNDLTVETDSPEIFGGDHTARGLLTAELETRVTATTPDGSWTTTSKFTRLDLQVDGVSEPDAARDLTNKDFTMTMDKNGRVIDVGGMENLAPGVDIRETLMQVNPTQLLPDRPIKVGETWPIEIKNPARLASGTVTQIMRGTGTLREVRDGRAFIDFDFTMEMMMEGPSQPGVSLSGSGKGKSSVAYDLEKARFVTNLTEMTMQTTGTAPHEGRAETIRTTVNSRMQVELKEG